MSINNNNFLFYFLKGVISEPLDTPNGIAMCCLNSEISNQITKKVKCEKILHVCFGAYFSGKLA